MDYIDGYVAAVPAANKDAYVAIARDAGKVFLEYGATRVVESWGDDVPAGEVTSFAMAVKVKADEVVVFAFVTWPDKATRDTGHAKAAEDPRLNTGNVPPFDSKRMVYGGFQMVLDMSAD
ncbi:DUF1428 domain-containing protein [Loktanella agnita]|uniref:DUF1428 domain-containing protein n=1 Tax=Loktanella agnita TaxID=287097 RepID=UPI003987013E